MWCVGIPSCGEIAHYNQLYIPSLTLLWPYLEPLFGLSYSDSLDDDIVKNCH